MRITVGTPYWGNYDKEHLHCVMALNREHPDVNTVEVQDCPYIDQAKSIIATRHMDDSDVIVIVDHDMIFKPEAVMMVAESAMEKGAVVGAAYGARMRGAKRPVAFVDLPVTFFEGGSVVPAVVVAGGFMAIPTALLHRMVGVLSLRKVQTCVDFMAYPFFHCIVDQDNGKWWGEDISFGMRVGSVVDPTKRNMNGPSKSGLFIDTRIRVGHKGAYIYQIEDGLMSVPHLDKVEIEEEKES